MQRKTMEMIKSHPGFLVLLAMMEQNFSSLTIDTAVNTIVMHDRPVETANSLMECLQTPGMTEKTFWRFLQNQVLKETMLMVL